MVADLIRSGIVSLDTKKQEAALKKICSNLQLIRRYLVDLLYVYKQGDSKIDVAIANIFDEFRSDLIRDFYDILCSDNDQLVDPAPIKTYAARFMVKYSNKDANFIKLSLKSADCITLTSVISALHLMPSSEIGIIIGELEWIINNSSPDDCSNTCALIYMVLISVVEKERNSSSESMIMKFFRRTNGSLKAGDQKQILSIINNISDSKIRSDLIKVFR